CAKIESMFNVFSRPNSTSGNYGNGALQLFLYVLYKFRNNPFKGKLFTLNLLHFRNAKMASCVERSLYNKSVRKTMIKSLPTTSDKTRCFNRTHNRNKGHIWIIFRIVRKLYRQSCSRNDNVYAT